MIEQDQYEVCSQCYSALPVTDFYPSALRKGFGPPVCKKCCKENKIKWEEDHPGRSRTRSKQWRARNPLAVRNKALKKYGICQVEYEALLAKQGGECAICGTAPTPGRRRLHVDHDHTSGRIRGILCVNCNTVLGKMGDSPARLHKAAEYLTGNT